MNSSLFDPNNHVPEVSPDDGWDDAEGLVPESVTQTTVLPPRRTASDRSSVPSVPSSDNDRTGLRIESNVQRGEPLEIPQRLEVQEINGSVVRLDQMAPAPPKVARLEKFLERPVREKNGKKSSGEGAQWGLAGRRPTFWIFGAGAAVIAIVVLGITVLPAINAPNAAKADPDGAVTGPVIEEKIEGMEAMNLLVSKQSEAMQAFRAFASASHFEDILPLLRDGKALEPLLRKSWQAMGVSNQWTPANDSNWSVVPLGIHPCGVLEGTLPDQSKFTAYFTNDNNRLLLDWKATTAYGTATFADLEKGQGDASEIRGEISPADFYGSTWPENEYQSYRLVSPDGGSLLWCYALRGGMGDNEIGPIFQKGEIVAETRNSRKVTLRLARGSGVAQPNQWLIEEMLHLDWVTP